MKLLRKIKLFFSPEYIITLPEYKDEVPYTGKHISYGTLCIYIDRDMVDMHERKIHMKYGIYIGDVVNAAIKANQVKVYGDLYWLSPEFKEAINNYKLEEKII